jgi:hypothetical protein
VGIQSPVSALPSGPMRDLVEALHELYRSAGMLSTRMISDMIRERDDFSDSVSHETVGLMLRGTRLIGWTKFECVVRLLAEKSVNPVFDPATSVRRFHNLWLYAKDAATPGELSLRTSPTPTTADLLSPLIRIPSPRSPSLGDAVPHNRTPQARRSHRLLTNLGERNRTFVGRADVHRELDRMFRAEPRLPVVLSGPGGVGKSQLAIEYAYRTVDRYDLIWYISAEDGFGAREMLAELGSRLRIRPGHHRERTVISVLRALEQTELRWLLIFDNAVPEIPLDTPVSGGVGDVIITTRAPEWTSTPVRLISVDVLARSESIRYLCAADDEISEADADGLADMLGDLPLALAQLAATRKATGMPLARYLDLYERHVQDLLRTARAPYYPASLGATVKMSIEQLNTRAAVLLLVELFAHFGPDPVPSSLLRSGRRAAVTDVLRRCVDDSRQLGASLDEIARLGLIRIEADGRHAVAPPTRPAGAAREPERGVAEPRSSKHAYLAGRGQPGCTGGAIELAGPRAADAAHPTVRDCGCSLPGMSGDGPPPDPVPPRDRGLRARIAEAAIASWSKAPDLGAEHESTLRAMALTLEARRSSGHDLHISGQYQRALAVECENYERHRRIHGADHPATLIRGTAGRAIYDGAETGRMGEWDVIISGDTFDEVQARLRDPRRRSHPLRLRPPITRQWPVPMRRVATPPSSRTPAFGIDAWSDISSAPQSGGHRRDHNAARAACPARSGGVAPHYGLVGSGTHSAAFAVLRTRRAHRGRLRRGPHRRPPVPGGNGEGAGRDGDRTGPPRRLGTGARAAGLVPRAGDPAAAFDAAALMISAALLTF